MRRRCYLALILTVILGLHRGNIALWQAGSPSAATPFPYRADPLPPSVYRALEEGIPFFTMEVARQAAGDLASRGKSMRNRAICPIDFTEETE